MPGRLVALGLFSVGVALAAWRSRKTYLVLASVLTLLVAMAALSAHGRSTVEPTVQAGPRASLTVAVEKVRSEAIATSISATGTVAAWQEASVGSEASGLRLTEVLVSEGDHVRAGDIVARLDASVLKAQLAEQKAAVEQAQATLDTAVSAAGRADRLLASKAISAETAEDKATAVKTGRAQLDQARAAADRLQAELDQATIRAPFDGIVSNRPAVPGSIIQSGTELMRVIRDGRLEVGVLVTEKDLPSVLVGQPANVVDAAGRTFAGRVSSIARTVSSTTRLSTVYVALSDGSGLMSGMFARVSIAGAATQRLSVAEAALVWREDKPMVFVVDAFGRAAARMVTTGPHQNGRVVIDNGLSEGESVVVAGAGFLLDGNLVRIADAQAGGDGERNGTQAAR